MIARENLFPLAIIVLSVGGATMYAFGGDVRRALYWAFAAGIGVVVTF